MNRAFEPGKYMVRLTRVALGKTSNGNPQVVFSFEPQGRLIAADKPMAQCPNFERSIFKVITDKTIDYFANDLEKLGYDREGFDELDSGHAKAFPFAGKEVMVKLEYETYQGKEKERWSFAFGGGLEVAPLERKEVSQLNASFSKKLKKPTSSQKPATATTTAPAAKSFEEQAEEVF